MHTGYTQAHVHSCTELQNILPCKDEERLQEGADPADATDSNE